MDKYQNKYRIPSARLQGYDYGQNGAYYITICTHNRVHYFGEIVVVETLHCNVSTMQLSEIGKLAEKYWMEIPNHFPFVKLGNFVVMPNHVHGILIIDNPDSLDNANIAFTTDSVGKTTVKTLHATSLPPIDKNEKMSSISPKSGTISTIIRSYKSVVSKYARQINPDFAWQPRFYDVVIRDIQSYENIHNYITNNPKNWGKDNFNT